MSVKLPPAVARRTVVLLNYMDVRNPRSGGAEVVCYEVAKRLVRAGFDVTWITSRFRGGDAEDTLDGIRILRTGSIYTTFLRSLQLYRRNFRDCAVIESINVIPYFTRLFSSGRSVLIIHHIVPLTVLFQKVGPLAPLADILQRRLGPVVGRWTSVVTLSQSTAGELRRLGYNKVLVCPLGTDSAPGPAERKERLVAIAGPLKPWKRIEDGIRAFAGLPLEWRLEIMGYFENAVYEQALQNLVGQLGLADRVAFRGYLSEQEKADLYSRAQVLLMTSKKEGWSIVSMEAQIHGCVVVGYEVPGVRDCVKDGVSAVLVPDGRIDQLGRALVDLCLDEPRIQQMSRLSSKRFQGRTWDRFVDPFIRAATGAPEPNVSDSGPSAGADAVLETRPPSTVGEPYYTSHGH